jgi:hypothetical protein
MINSCARHGIRAIFMKKIIGAILGFGALAAGGFFIVELDMPVLGSIVAVVGLIIGGKVIKD